MHFLNKNGKYIYVPVCKKDKQDKTYLSCKNEDGIVWEMLVSKMNPEDTPLFYASLPAGEKDVWFEGDFSETFFANISMGNEPYKAMNIHPSIHFAAANGWINDPNGLIYHNGLYHMYFQYNPLDIVWENMCWGHAVSKDLLHWEQLDTVMYPDEDGTIFSGSAVANDNGLLDLPDDALLYFYTCAGGTSNLSKGKKFTQKLAYSADGGNTLVKIKEPVVDHIVFENRDPKVYLHEETKTYFMALYLEKNRFGILKSKDLKSFELVSEFDMENSWECPDLRELSCDDGKRRWIFFDADGNYMTGQFDGERFTRESDIKCAYRTKLAYAAQTFNKPNDPVILLPWLKTSNENCTYTGLMGLPRELSLVKRGQEYVLRLDYIRQYRESRKPSVDYHYDYNKCISKELELGCEKPCDFLIKIGEVKINYEAASGKIMVDNQTIEFKKNCTQFSILIDKGILEISSGDFIDVAYVEVDEEKMNGDISVDCNAYVKIYECC